MGKRGGGQEGAYHELPTAHSHRRVVVLLDVRAHHQAALRKADDVETTGELGVRLHDARELVGLHDSRTIVGASAPPQRRVGSHTKPAHGTYLRLHGRHERLEAVGDVDSDGIRAGVPVRPRPKADAWCVGGCGRVRVRNAAPWTAHA